MAVPLSVSTRNTVIAGLAATAVGVSALVGIQVAASASLTDAPVINEFVTDTAGTDVLEFAEILVPENFDTAELHVVGIEGDGNSNQGKAVHVYPLADVEFDDDGRGVLTVPVNGFQNGSLTLALVNGAVASNTQMDAELDGVLDDAALADQGVEVLDVVGLHDGDSGDLAWGTELSASDFDGYTSTLGGASRVPDGSDTWVPNAYNGAGLPGIDAAPRGEFEVASAPGTANGEGAGTPEPEPTDEPSEPGAVCDADVTSISEVQGAGAATPLNDQNVTVRGVVVGDFFNASGGSNGFWVQERDETADDDLATSEAVFVHHPNAEAPEQGTLVTVSGRAGEYDNQTQLSNTTMTECGTAELPAPVEISFPVEEDYEHLEGMRVTIPEAIVLETYQFGRYGEVVVGPERQFTPTAIHAPESAEAQELYESNQANRITIDDRNSIQNYYPAEHLNGEPFSIEDYFRGGDTFRDLTGVMDFRNSVWKIQRTEAADYENTVPRESEVPDVGGDVQVAAFNVLNYFTTFNSRGAQDDEEFERQKAKLVAAIGDLGSDVVGLMEIENNNDVALRDLVDGVNNYLDEDRYVALETGRLGTDQITTAMMYDPEAVTPAGAHQVLDGSVDSRFNTSRHRPALAQTFTAAGETGELGEFTVITNHLKSKGSECGSEDNNTHLVGSCDAERTAAAEALVDWAVDAELPKPVMMGDLNAYDHEAPITTLTEGGYVDLKKEYEGEEAYSYVFDGQLGYLDYAMAHEDIMPHISGAASWHTNSDEISVLDYQTRFHTDPRQDDIYAPDVYRSSDHDPVVFGLNLDESGTEPSEPGEPGDGDIPVEAEIPGLPGDDDDNNAPGSLVLSIADGTTTLGNQRNAGDRLRVTGELPTVSVTDTRRTGAGWAMAGQSSDLSIAGDSGESVTADHLGWAPFVNDTTNSATPGEVSRGVLAGGEGLAAPATLGSATEETRLGTSDLAADLVLEVPVDTEAGTYTGALSVSLFPVD
ncbi:ExeM/NucH family extracellular endonuclease [Citricoccus muralis]|uniref:ExeM/NucH family extracellular endonuclease n=1 Tax=Citricoccus muralis TaxID=169134 RepID=A0ABY8H5W4_9MICC|nr:ExeM/NucH family extracellular endonuclease [Citricoccus muralis]WFP16047.1 ExeM/NucH family extracellular endonuclease [Citricoccus muralis]